jgi:hypothetical protein
MPAADVVPVWVDLLGEVHEILEHVRTVTRAVGPPPTRDHAKGGPADQRRRGSAGQHAELGFL